MKTGIIGCGNIADIYFSNSIKYFNNFEIVACADIKPEASKHYANIYNVENLTIDQILNNDEIELIINLTIPDVHFEVSKSIIQSGKHAYSEKPLSIEFHHGKKLLELSRQKNLYLGCAPDTFLGAGIQESKKILSNNKIGNIVLGSISMGVAGHEIWHPNPDFYYQYGGGPVLDMGPYYFTALVNLLGPAKNIYSQSRTVYNKRVIGSGERKNQQIKVDIPTTLISQIEFENGTLIDSFFSFDIWKHNKNHIELYGDLGSINIPDPNTFGGSIQLCTEKNGEWKTIETNENNLGKINVQNSKKTNEKPGIANYRGIGVSEMVDSIKNNRLNRCNGELSLHVLDILDTIIKSAKEDKKLELRSSVSAIEYFSEEENFKLLK